MNNNRFFRRATLAVAVCVFATLFAAGTASAQGPLACSGEAYIVQDSVTAGIDGQLTRVAPVMGMGGFVFNDIGSPQNEYNNIGFNRNDGLIYGVQLRNVPTDGSNGNNGIIRVGDNGIPAMLGNPTSACGTPWPTGTRFDAGDVNEAGDRLFVNQAGSGRLWILDITVTPPNAVSCPTITPNNSGAVNDWAFNAADGNLYGGDTTGGQVARINLAAYAGGATISRSDSNVSGMGFSGTGAFGGAWFDAAGSLFLYRNGTVASPAGTIHEVINVTGMGATFEVVDTQSGPGSSRNDGAACAQNVIGVGKAMNSALAGFPDTITIDYVFENLGTETLDMLSALDDLTAVFGATGAGPCAFPTGTPNWIFGSISSTPMGFANASYDGSGDTELIAAGQSLTSGTSATVQVTITLCNQEFATPPNPPGTGGPPYLFFNSVLFTGENPTGVLFGDVSHSVDGGMGPDTPDADPDADGSPDEDDQAQVPVELQTFSID